MKRTHNCGELNLKYVKQNVIIAGFVNKVRKLGAMTFIDIRDMYGLTQVVINEKTIENELLNKIKKECVVSVSGMVTKRKSINKDIKTGDIEIIVESLQLLSIAKMTPLLIQNNTDALEDIRLKYRYLDLRRPVMKDIFLMRNQINWEIRKYLQDNKFIEIETPILNKSTPEGARDFVIPSRMNSNKFYALPQSPQLFKQLLMISGFDRYYQIAKCFRDEDLRSDRQLEFTQLDMEIAFTDFAEIRKIIEPLFQNIFKKIKKIDIKAPFKTLTYVEAMKNYGTDKPDLRYDLLIKVVCDAFRKSQFKIFESCANNKEKVVNSIFVEKIIDKKQINELTRIATQNKAQGLAWIKYENNEYSGPIVKFLTNEELENFSLIVNPSKKTGTFLIIADFKKNAYPAMGAVRVEVANMFQLNNNGKNEFVWITEWPLFEWDDEENKLTSAHHPFTSPVSEHLSNFDTNPLEAKAQAYDLVLNGYEIGGGSIRIHDLTIQKRMFNTLKLSSKQIEEKFGWFLKAFDYGVPPHGGIAFGLDRITMILSETTSIRDVIAFPVNSSGVNTMCDSPDAIDSKQLKELKLKLIK
ncbi:aspartate--tRNA ligase [Spiroplasma endosymbiont of Amphibalanus improvisus]|uniref:aspartate--tRNA ligase n=1 Tax=Spiroplasma endosymbiont of Amphibalanus improvisus TaxID=3066327 RepID=UPI00313E236D